MFRSRPLTGSWVHSPVHAPTLSILPPITYEIFPSSMASNSPPSQNSRVPHKPAPVSPGQAIAEAWKRESLENQERWRKLDADVKRRYEEARKKKQTQSKM